MADHERRITPRKSYAIPLRFNVITEQYAMAGVATARQSANILTTIPLPKQGEIVNLSERGIGFRTRQNLNVDENVEIFFTLPTALTGRAPEDARCNARVVRVAKNGDTSGMTGIGAPIERFERTSVARHWDNEQVARWNCGSELSGWSRNHGERHLRRRVVFEAVENLHGDRVRAWRKTRKVELITFLRSIRQSTRRKDD
jgi:hypothetical protein